MQQHSCRQAADVTRWVLIQTNDRVQSRRTRRRLQCMVGLNHFLVPSSVREPTLPTFMA